MIYIRKILLLFFVSVSFIIILKNTTSAQSDSINNFSGDDFTIKQSNIVEKTFNSYTTRYTFFRNELTLKSKLENKLGMKIKELRPIVCELTYYTSLPCENGVYGLKTASGVNMNSKTVANNYLKFGTEIYINGYGYKVVQDVGSDKHFNRVNRFDIYVPQKKNESDYQYYKRVNSMGKKTEIGYIIITK